MGVVYKARHSALGHEVAIKVLLANLAMNESVRARFHQEAQLQASLQHPNIVRVVDLIEGDRPAIVMDLVRGPSLAEVISGQGPWPVDRVLTLMDPVVEAIALAHREGVIHRDLKPGNILLDREGGQEVPKVSDFGIAKILQSDALITRTGTRMGTVPYMSPEQFRGLKDLDARADVFALGMLFWRLLRGRLPLDPDDLMSVMGLYSGQSGALTLPDGLCGPRVRSMVGRALSVGPAGRFEDAEAMLAALRDEAAPKISGRVTRLEGRATTIIVAESEGGADAEAPTAVEPDAIAPTVEAPTPPTALAIPRPQPRRSPVVVVLSGTLAAVLVAALFGGVVVWFSGGLPEPPEVTPMVYRASPSVSALSAHLPKRISPADMVTLYPRGDSARARTLNAEGFAHRQAGEHGKALAAYLSAVAADPSLPSPRFNLACELALIGSDVDAVAHLEVLYHFDTPRSRRLLLKAEAEKDLQAIWRDPKLVAMLDEVSERSAIGLSGGLEQPGCAGWDADDGAVLCAWHCDTSEDSPSSGLLVLRPDQTPKDIDLKRSLLLDDPEAHREAMRAVSEELARLHIPPRRIPVWPLKPGSLTTLSDGYAVRWQASHSRPHVFEVRGLESRAVLEAGGEGWRGCGQGVDHTQPVEAVAYLIPRLGLVAIVGRFASACCDEIAGEGGSWSGMGFVFL